MGSGTMSKGEGYMKNIADIPKLYEIIDRRGIKALGHNNLY